MKECKVCQLELTFLMSRYPIVVDSSLILI